MEKEEGWRRRRDGEGVMVRKRGRRREVLIPSSRFLLLTCALKHTKLYF